MKPIPNQKTNQVPLNLGFSLKKKTKGVTPDLINSILWIMLFHIGRENFISRQDLVQEVNAQGIATDERTVRLAISEMRRQLGVPLAGTGGRSGGYWLLKDQEEADAYLAVQLHDPGINLLEQEKSIRKNFNRWFHGNQLTLPTSETNPRINP